MTASAASQGRVSRDERRELKSLAKDSFSLVRQDVHQRQQQIRRDIEEALDAEYEDSLKEMRKEAMKLRDRLAKLNEAVDAYFEKAEELGLESQAGPRSRYDDKPAAKLPMLEMGVPQKAWRIERAYRRVAQEKGFADLDLNRRELEMMVKIAESGLQSADAQKLLTQLPKSDDLVPANGAIPSAVKAVLEEKIDDDDGDDV